MLCCGRQHRHSFVDVNPESQRSAAAARSAGGAGESHALPAGKPTPATREASASPPPGSSGSASMSSVSGVPDASPLPADKAARASAGAPPHENGFVRAMHSLRDITLSIASPRPGAHRERREKRPSLRISRGEREGLDPNVLPHPVDERVDVCHAETAEHIKLRHRLRQQLLDEGIYQPWLDNNHALMRFMRARGFNYEKTLLMLRACLAWRVENDVDGVLGRWRFTERKAVKRWYPYTHHRVDKFGRVVYIERVGRINFNELEKVTTFERLLESFVYDAELTATRRLPAAGRTVGHPVDKILTILDLDGFKLSMFDQRARDYLTKVSKLASDNYPEQLGQMFIVNAPVAFRAVWSFVKPLLDVKTQQKIRIYSTHGYQDELLRHVHAENLPVAYGGQDASCDFQTEQGPWVDDEWRQRYT